MPQIADWLKGHGTFGVVLYAVTFAVLAGVALLPTYAQSALGGYAFGLAVGAPAAIVGFGVASLIGFGIARRVSRDRVEQLIETQPKWRAIREALLGPTDDAGVRTPAGFWKTTGMIALIRMPPNSPFALTNLVLASVKVPLGSFVLGTMIGMAPRTTIAVFIGSLVEGALTEDNLKQVAPAWLWYVGIAVSIGIMVFIALIAQKALNSVTAAHAAKSQNSSTANSKAQQSSKLPN
jgi:uncharacterized membrane protein YdjX (TVP38/TMEM64 family)